MAKKWKQSSFRDKYRARDAEPERALDTKKARIVNADVNGTSAYGETEQDAFEANRDSVLLEGADERMRGGLDDDLSSDDEVFALNLKERGSDDDEESDESDDDAESEPEAPAPRKRRDTDDATKGRFGKETRPGQDILSDDDADRYALSDDAEDGYDQWLPQHYHATKSAPGEYDEDEPEALELELAEATRLQRAQRSALEAEDFGLDEASVGEARGVSERVEEDEEDGEAAEATQVHASEPEAVYAMLLQSPETLALLDDFNLWAGRLSGLHARVAKLPADDDFLTLQRTSTAYLEYQHVLSYVATLIFYFTLLTADRSAPELVEDVIARLATLRERLAVIDQMGLSALEDAEETPSERIMKDIYKRKYAELMMLKASEAEEDEDEVYTSMFEGLTDDEVEGVMEALPSEATMDDLIHAVEMYRGAKAQPAVTEEPPRKKSKKASTVLAEAEAEAEAGPSTNGSSRGNGHSINKGSGNGSSSSSSKTNGHTTTNTSKRPRKQIADVVPGLPEVSAASTAPASSAPSDDYVDPTALDTADKSEKTANRHSLRFHVSQVNQKTAKREGKNRGRLEGDADIPVRSKERARREVMRAKQHVDAPNPEDVRLDDDEYSELDLSAADAVRGDGDDASDDDFYEQVRAEQSEGRALKKMKYDDDKLEIRDALMAGEDVDGPRGASRQILANKGLTPRRPKENRNPRVKKRMRYAKAQKQISSMKPVYSSEKAQAGRTQYEGEGSGVGRVVKSVKL